MPKHFCQEYKDVFVKLQDEGIFTPTRIPQLEEMSNFLKSKYLLCYWFIIKVASFYWKVDFCFARPSFFSSKFSSAGKFS